MPYVFNPLSGGLDFVNEQTDSFDSIEANAIIVNGTQIIGSGLVLSGVTIDNGEF
ncbi:MAG: hypothetical protein ACO3HP_04610 [Candidatus Nanopelagicaceae bacterium]